MRYLVQFIIEVREFTLDAKSNPIFENFSGLNLLFFCQNLTSNLVIALSEMPLRSSGAEVSVAHVTFDDIFFEG